MVRIAVAKYFAIWRNGLSYSKCSPRWGGAAGAARL